jgi:hypothetical protein
MKRFPYVLRNPEDDDDDVVSGHTACGYIAGDEITLHHYSM